MGNAKFTVFLLVGGFAAVLLIIIALKKLYGYRRFYCRSCGAEFKYQNFKAATCPDCGGCLEEENAI